MAGWMRVFHSVLSGVMDLQAAVREVKVADHEGHHATYCRGWTSTAVGVRPPPRREALTMARRDVSESNRRWNRRSAPKLASYTWPTAGKRMACRPRAAP